GELSHREGAASMTPTEMEAELERLHATSFAWALACCGRDREEASDVIQTTYLKLLDGRARFEGRASFKTFLFGGIRRTASEERRRRAFRHLLGRQGASSSVANAAPEVRIAVVSALAKLARRQREVLELVFYMGMTLEEAAGVLAISVGSA